MQENSQANYSRVWNKRTPIFINFWNFFPGAQSYYRLKRIKFYYISLHILRSYAYSFCHIIRGYIYFKAMNLFKGLCLFRTLEYPHSNV